MIAILCNSPCLSSEIASSVHPLFSFLFTSSNSPLFSSNSDTWLSDCLLNNSISTVFYESRFFIDPSYFQSLSPDTRFVLLSAYGEESFIKEALVCGATAFLQKPVHMSEVLEVLTLVKK